VKWLSGLLLLLLLASLGGTAFCLWQFRLRYVAELERQVWPAGTEEPGVMMPSGGSTWPTIVLLGDSRIAEWRLPEPRQGRLVNAGLSGATTARILATAPEVLRKFSPDIVVIEAGINDVKLAGARPEFRENVVKTASGNIEKLVKMSTDAGARVILLPVWPYSEPSLLRRPVWNEAAVARTRDDLNAQLRALEAPGIVFVDLFVEGGVTPRFRDTLHLTPETYQSLTPVLLRRVEELRSSPGK